MSFRELRDFTEYMRVLGYPRLVSVDNFRTPNFGLVADSLYWMVHRYDPSVSISDDISTEECRIEFLTSVAHVMWSKSGLKLNTKRLYSADGKAVKELLKVATLLHSAHRNATLSMEGEESGSKRGMGGEGKTGEMDGPESDGVNQQIALGKLPDVKATKKLASSITESGARLFDLLNEERDISSERQRAVRFLDSISNNLDSTSEQAFVERKASELLEDSKERCEAMRKQCKDLTSDENTLRAKIEKKKGELERNDKRLKSLKSVRPAFMDEYEKLEQELSKQYEVYIEKFRNLDYLESRLEAFNRKEREKLEASERARKRIQANAMEKKQRDLRGGDMDDDGSDDEIGLGRGDKNDYRLDDGVDSAGSGERARFSNTSIGMSGPGRGFGSSGLSGGSRRNKQDDDDESDISAESEDSNNDSDDDLSDESSGSGSLSDGGEDLIDEDDGDGSDLSSDNEDGGDAIGSHSDASEESDDNF